MLNVARLSLRQKFFVFGLMYEQSCSSCREEHFYDSLASEMISPILFHFSFEAGAEALLRLLLLSPFIINFPFSAYFARSLLLSTHSQQLRSAASLFAIN